MRRAMLLCVPLAACSAASDPADRYQYFDGSKESIDLVFDRQTGCIAEIKRVEGNADVPDWAAETVAKADSKKIERPADLEYHGPIKSFEPWRCPSPAPASSGEVRK